MDEVYASEDNTIVDVMLKQKHILFTVRFLNNK